MSRRACEHVTEVTVRHEGKPSGFGRVRLDIGVIPQRQKSGEIPRHFPLKVRLVSSHLKANFKATSDQNPALPLVILTLLER